MPMGILGEHAVYGIQGTLIGRDDFRGGLHDPVVAKSGNEDEQGCIGQLRHDRR